LAHFLKFLNTIYRYKIILIFSGIYGDSLKKELKRKARLSSSLGKNMRVNAYIKGNRFNTSEFLPQQKKILRVWGFNIRSEFVIQRLS